MGAIPSQIESLYSEKFDSLVGFARRRLPDQIDPEDVVQASFLKLLERADIDTLDVPASYLMTVVKNEVIAQLRAESSLERVVDRVASLPASDTPDPIDEVEQAEIARIAAAVTKTLPARQKRILAKYLSGMSPAQIAKSESNGRIVHANQISSLLVRTSRKLQRTMATRGLMSAGPLVQIRRRLRDCLVRLRHSERMAEGQTLLIACVVTASQLAAGGGFAGQRTEIPGLHGDGGSQRTSGKVSVTQGAKTTKTFVREGAASVKRNLASLDLAKRHAELEIRDERDGQHATPIEQVIQLIQDPSKVPLPDCGGLPGCP